MQFALLIYENAGDFARRRGPEAAAYWSSWAAYSGALEDRMPLGACLQAPETGVVLRRSGDTRRITDGAYSDSPEQLGGVIMIASFFSTSLAIVDLPEPDSPVNHSTRGVWFFIPAWCSRVMSVGCQ